MSYPFYRHLPLWITKSIQNKCCPKCNNKTTNTDIIACGIRLTNDCPSWFIEYKCEECEFREIVNISTVKETSVEELCFIMLESTQKINNIQSSVRPHCKKGKISDKEVSLFLKMLNNTKDYSEFLKNLNIEIKNDTEDKNKS